MKTPEWFRRGNRPEETHRTATNEYPISIRFSDPNVLSFVLERIIVPSGIVTEEGHAAFDEYSRSIVEVLRTNHSCSFTYHPEKMAHSPLKYRKTPVSCKITNIFPEDDPVYILYIGDSAIGDEISTLLNK